jgi:hypothetical protein
MKKNDQLIFLTQQDINNYVKSNQNPIYDDLKEKWTKKIKISDKMLYNISKDSEYLEKNLKSIENCIEDLNRTLDYNNEIGVNCDSIGYIKNGLQNLRRSLERNYRYLSSKYYKYMFDNNKKEFDKIKKESQNIDRKMNKLMLDIANKIDKSFEKVDNKINESLENVDIKICESENNISRINDRIEGLGGTFLNIVLTISIVSSMVAVLVNAKPEYSITIVLACAWLLLSSILFISEYYKNPENKTRFTFGKKVYIILSIVTLISCLPIVLKKYDNKEDSKVYLIDTLSEAQYSFVTDKKIINDFIKKFSPYWEENDINYTNNKDYINTKYISKIIFYKYTEGNIDLYKYELLLSNDKSISLKINDDDLEIWLQQKEILIK